MTSTNDPLQSEFENKVGQIRSGGPSGGFQGEFLRSGGSGRPPKPLKNNDNQLKTVHDLIFL